MNGKPWTVKEDAVLHDRYADSDTSNVAKLIGRTASATYQRARMLGLHKSPERLTRNGKRLARHANCNRFQKGHATWNAGKKGWQSGGRSKQTQFRKGNKPQTWRPVGAERVDRDGITYRKVSDTGARRKDWRAVIALVWEAARGPIPSGHFVVFRAGMKTTDSSAITADRLELVDRAENMRRNSYLTRYPKEVADVIRMRGVLNRKIRNRSKK